MSRWRFMLQDLLGNFVPPLKRTEAWWPNLIGILIGILRRSIRNGRSRITPRSFANGRMRVTAEAAGRTMEGARSPDEHRKYSPQKKQQTKRASSTAKVYLEALGRF